MVVIKAHTLSYFGQLLPKKKKKKKKKIFYLKNNLKKQKKNQKNQKKKKKEKINKGFDAKEISSGLPLSHTS